MLQLRQFPRITFIAYADRLRFGGVKQSGFGREGSQYGISEYQVMFIPLLRSLSNLSYRS
jgi:acyl-CoA reductase-like NAD-dependent aldehyde dehydrogenase